MATPATRPTPPADMTDPDELKLFEQVQTALPYVQLPPGLADSNQKIVKEAVETLKPGDTPATPATPA
jgi:hypothetical protein